MQSVSRRQIRCAFVGVTARQSRTNGDLVSASGTFFSWLLYDNPENSYMRSTGWALPLVTGVRENINNFFTCDLKPDFAMFGRYLVL